MLWSHAADPDSVREAAACVTLSLAESAVPQGQGHTQ